METIERQTRAACGCLVAGKLPWVWAWTAAYCLYAHSVCDTEAPLRLRYAACGTVVLYAFAIEFG